MCDLLLELRALLLSPALPSARCTLSMITLIMMNTSIMIILMVIALIVMNTLMMIILIMITLIMMIMIVVLIMMMVVVVIIDDVYEDVAHSIMRIFFRRGDVVASLTISLLIQVRTTMISLMWLTIMLLRYCHQYLDIAIL